MNSGVRGGIQRAWHVRKNTQICWWRRYPVFLCALIILPIESSLQSSTTWFDRRIHLLRKEMRMRSLLTTSFRLRIDRLSIYSTIFAGCLISLCQHIVLTDGAIPELCIPLYYTAHHHGSMVTRRKQRRKTKRNESRKAITTKHQNALPSHVQRTIHA